GQRLVAHLVATSDDIEIAAVKAALAQSLPSYMVPDGYLVLPALPLTANGKLDRAALPHPEFAPTAHRAPATPLEALITRIYAEVLGLEQVGADDTFFERGGPSLTATPLAVRLGKALGRQVPVLRLFTATTPAALAAELGAGSDAVDEAALDVL